MNSFLARLLVWYSSLKSIVISVHSFNFHCVNISTCFSHDHSFDIRRRWKSIFPFEVRCLVFITEIHWYVYGCLAHSRSRTYSLIRCSHSKSIVSQTQSKSYCTVCCCLDVFFWLFTTSSLAFVRSMYESIFRSMVYLSLYMLTFEIDCFTNTTIITLPSLLSSWCILLIIHHIIASIHSFDVRVNFSFNGLLVVISIMSI